MALGRAAASASARSFTPAMPSSASDHYFSCRNRSKSALLPSCLFSAVASSTTTARPINRSAFLPSSLYSLSAPSWSHCFLVGSRGFKVVGIDVGFDAKFVRHLRTRRAWGALGLLNARSMSERSEGGLEDAIRTKNSLHAVVLYSKTWCPYCSMVKSLFSKLGVSYELVELDELADEQDVQDALIRLTGQSTVPSIFIGGTHIGGCDDTMDLHQRGELLPALQAAGATITTT